MSFKRRLSDLFHGYVETSDSRTDDEDVVLVYLMDKMTTPMVYNMGRIFLLTKMREKAVGLRRTQEALDRLVSRGDVRMCGLATQGHFLIGYQHSYAPIPEGYLVISESERMKYRWTPIYKQLEIES